jgi:hypothetical protein
MDLFQESRDPPKLSNLCELTIHTLNVFTNTTLINLLLSLSLIQFAKRLSLQVYLEDTLLGA